MAAAPCEVWFYHLERTALDQALPALLEKALAKGWRALVRSSAAERIEHLDGWLWSWRDDSFTPHGMDGESDAALQPILLTTAMANANGANALFVVDGADPGDLTGYERCVVLFDGRDEAAVQDARVRWKGFSAQGLPVSYWRQDERGGWRKQA